MAISTAPFVPAPLTRLDRCDRCSAAALVRVTLPSGGELQFCGHHARKHEARLLEIGAGLSSAV
jgi:hypothetical protein